MKTDAKAIFAVWIGTPGVRTYKLTQFHALLGKHLKALKAKNTPAG